MNFGLSSKHLLRIDNKTSINVTTTWAEFILVLHFSVSAIIILHHGKKERAKTRPGVVAVLLCQLHVLRLTGFDSSGCWRWGGRWVSLPLCITESEMSISGSSFAHTRPDQRSTVLAQILLLLQRPRHLLPVEFNIGSVLETSSRSGDVLTAEAPAPLLAGDTEGEEVLTCCCPRTLWLVFCDQFALNGLCGDRFGLTAPFYPWPVLVLSSVHPSSSPSMTLLTAAQHQLMGNTSQDQQDGDIGEESHETITKHLQEDKFRFRCLTSNPFHFPS